MESLLHNITEAMHQALQAARRVVSKDFFAHLVQGASAGFGANLVTIGAMGGAAAVSAAIEQVEYKHKNIRLRETYQDEIRATLGKEGKSLTRYDLERVADGNRVIAEAMQKNSKQRNLGVVLSAVASVASLAIILFAFPPIAAASAGWLTIAAKGIVGLATYTAISAPLHWVGDKYFEVNKKTTHDRIMELKRDRAHGKSISREQVFSVFVSADPDLSDRLRQRTNGRAYDVLDTESKQRLAAEIGGGGLQQLTDDINAGRVHMTELAFAVVGQESGVKPHAPDTAHKPGLFTTVKDKLQQVAHSVMPSHSEPGATGISHVERLKQSRAHQHITQR